MAAKNKLIDHVFQGLLSHLGVLKDLGEDFLLGEVARLKLGEDGVEDAQEVNVGELVRLFGGGTLGREGEGADVSV